MIAEPGSAMIVEPASHLAVPPNNRLNNPFITGLLFKNLPQGYATKPIEILYRLLHYNRYPLMAATYTWIVRLY